MRSKVPLSNYANVLMGQSPKGDTCNSNGKGLPLLNGPTEFGSKFPVPAQFTSDPKRMSKVNDILFCVRGSTTGRMNYADREYAIGRGIAAIRGINGFPTVFVKGLIDQNLQHLLNIATGSTFPNVSKDMINSFEVEEVSKDRAIKISYILSNLDDKIELNRKMNQTLESMAQALFKSWFVDFAPVHAKANASGDADYERIAKELGVSREVLDLFPDEFEESELGLIPKGWSIKSFSTVATLSTKSVKPYDEPSKLWSHFSIPAYDSFKYPIHELGSEIKSNKYKIDLSAVLVSKLNPTTERVWLPNIVNQEASICSTEFMQFVPFDSEYRSYIYYLIKSNNFQHEIKSRVTGTTGSRQRSQPPQVAMIDVVKPARGIIDKFVGLTSFTTDKLLSNIEEIQTLKKTRDTLLPKLLLGELDVSELEIDHVTH
jgi:type I restriction enzyme, S subunit